MQNRMLTRYRHRESFAERLHHLAPPERVELERATGEGVPEPESEGTTTEQVTDADERD